MSYISISKSAYFHNLRSITKITGIDKCAVVLKDNAYGHDLLLMANLAHEFGIKKCVVRTVDEAMLIKDLFDLTLILADIPKTLLDSKISVTINSILDLKKVPQNSSIHIKVDTGMHRNGINTNEIIIALDIARENNLNIDGIFSHCRSCDELSTEGFWQLQNFKKLKNIVLEYVKNHKIKTPLFHLSNSATLARFKEDAIFDMVRVGIASYGYSENAPSLDNLDLLPILSLWGEKISSREVLKGQKVGYGGAFLQKDDGVISCYDVGYGDGFFRSNGTKNITTPLGNKILGKISMDSMFIDSNEDKICIFDNAKTVAKEFESFSYEILVKLMPHIKRIIID